MRKLISLILVLALSLCLVGAHAEQDNFLISDWTLITTLGDTVISEITAFIYDNGTFEITNGEEIKQGTWSFDGVTLVLTVEDEPLALTWDEAAHEFSAEVNGANVRMVMPIEPEEGTAGSEGTMGIPELAGGWNTAEDPAITEEISSLFWNGMDNYQTGTITVSYIPVAYLGWQIVAGTNHAILCRSQEINHPAVWVIVYLYADLEGNVSVLDISELPLGV